MPSRKLPLVGGTSRAGSARGGGSVGRRELIRLIGGAATIFASAPGIAGCKSDKGQSAVFSDDERSALAAFADVIIPPDDEPGGAALGAVDFIERLVTAFDDASVIPPIFAGGPFSGRQPLPDETGHASANFPPNDFATFIELDRVNEAAWRLKVLGSAGLPNGAPNEQLKGALKSLKDQILDGIHSAMKTSETPITQQPYDDLLVTFNSQLQDWKDLMVELVTQAAFAAPEYGGNIGTAGWKMCHFEGDGQPFGYSQWDGKQFVERPESPLSTANPGPDPAPIGADVDMLLSFATEVLGGKVQ
jgi:hypothetical protein